MREYQEVIELSGKAVDLAGVTIIAAGGLFAGFMFVRRVRSPGSSPYQGFRQDLGRAIVLGLEFLVAGDIIRTVVVAPTLENVITLGLVVAIRTFLSLGLKLEIDGRWPWQPSDATRP